MLFGLTENTIQDIQEVFRIFTQIEEVVIYGSRAKGNYRNGSDIDLTLKGDSLNESILNKISLELDELKLPYCFDLSLFSKIDNENLLEHIQRVGISFYRIER